MVQRSFFTYNTIQKKLRLLALVASLGGLAIISVALTFYDQYTARRALHSELTIIGKMVANRTSAAILFSDTNLAASNLSHMRVHEAITDACIVLRSGEMFAQFHRDGAVDSSCQQVLLDRASLLEGERLGNPVQLALEASLNEALIFAEPIFYNGEVIGEVIFRAELNKIVDRIINFAAAAISIAFVTGLLVFLFTSKIQNSIAMPLLQLTRVARYVGDERDYSVRADKQSNDELGELVDAFNSMLDKIERQNKVMNQSSQDLRQLVRKKTEAEARLSSILGTAPDAVFTVSDKYLVQSVNEAAQDLFQWQETEMLGRKLSLFLPYLRAEGNFSFIDSLPKLHELQGERKDHSFFPLELSVSDTLVDNRKIFTCTMRDVSLRKQAEEEIRVLSQAIEQSPSSVVITDENGVVQYMNNRFESIVGMEESAYVRRFPNLFDSNIDPGAELEDVLAQLDSGQEWRGEVRNQKPNGESFWESVVFSSITAEHGRFSYLIRSSEDISIRKAQEEKLRHQANFDALTGLPNRTLAYDRLKLALAQAKRNDQHVVVMFLDLDRFKYINDTLGHDAGDQLLIEAAVRLKDCIREDCTVARLGGDEFLVILPNVEEPAHSEQVAQRIISSFTQPFLIAQQEFTVTASIGVAVFPADGENVAEVLRSADTAMYRAKDQGRSNFEYFTIEMNQKANERLQIESQLRNAVAKQETYMLYQPIIHPKSGKMIGVESLLRWHNKDLGLVDPGQFIPIAEDSDLIVALGNWCIDESCRQLSAWQDEGLFSLGISVNVSARQFKEVALVSAVEAALRRHGVSASRLQLEVRETVLLENEPMVSVVIERLKDLGVQLAVDDFGTGYSALSYLQQYPFDVLKIDRSFVRDIANSERDAALCSAMINMAHSLGLKVVGEGVENQAQLSVLAQSQCDMVQGYCFAEPLPPAEVVSFAEMISNASFDVEYD